MVSDEALLLLSVATAFAFISAQPTCRNTVNCSCFRTGKRFTICAEQNTALTDPCTRWPGCKSCHGGSVGHSSFAGTNPIPRSQQNWQYGSYSREERRSHPTNPVRSQRLSEADPVVTCTDPGQVANADRRNINGSPSLGVQNYRIGQSVTYTCRAGYALQGRKLITCQTSGSWSDSLPYCRPNRISETVVPTATVAPVVTCPDPGQVDNADRHNTDSSPFRRVQNYRIGQSVAYICREGYALQGHSLITCQISGSWSNSLPNCTPMETSMIVVPTPTDPVVTCPDPGQVANANRRNIDGSPSLGIQDYRTGQSVAYTCRTGYTRQRRKIITCQTSGSWSDSLPYCTPNLTPETVVYTPTAISEQREQLVFCKDPGPVKNANRVPVDAPNNRGFPKGSILEYSCNQGYTLQGLESISCLVSGKWSSTVPRCEAQFGAISEQREELIFCKDPGPVVNANRVPINAPNSRGFPQGSSLEYSCNQGYTLQGVGSIFCLVSGRWSSAVPRCEAQFGSEILAKGDGEFCLNPGNIQNGKITYFPNMNDQTSWEDGLDEPEYPPNSLLVHSCNEGYRLQGAPEMRCLGATGFWSIDQPTCVQA